MALPEQGTNHDNWALGNISLVKQAVIARINRIVQVSSSRPGDTSEKVWRIRKRDQFVMKALGIVFGIIVVGILGVMVYALQVDPPQEKIEVVIPDDKLPN